MFDTLLYIYNSFNSYEQLHYLVKKTFLYIHFRGIYKNVLVKKTFLYIHFRGIYKNVLVKKTLHNTFILIVFLQSYLMPTQETTFLSQTVHRYDQQNTSHYPFGLIFHFIEFVYSFAFEIKF